MTPDEEIRQRLEKWRGLLNENKVIFEVIGICAAVAGLFLLWGQYREMVTTTKATLNSIELTRHALEDTRALQRGRLAIENITFRPLKMDKNETSFDFSYNVKNVGLTPAFEIRFVPAMVCDTSEFDALARSDPARFQKLTEGVFGVLAGGQNMSPSQVATNRQTARCSINGQDETKHLFHFQVKHFLIYDDVFGNTWVNPVLFEAHFEKEQASLPVITRILPLKEIALKDLRGAEPAVGRQTHR